MILLDYIFLSVILDPYFVWFFKILRTSAPNVSPLGDLASLQTKRFHICRLFKRENALVEANQLQIKWAEVVTRLDEACQAVKLFNRLHCKLNLSLPLIQHILNKCSCNYTHVMHAVLWKKNKVKTCPSGKDKSYWKWMQHFRDDHLCLNLQHAHY